MKIMKKLCFIGIILALTPSLSFGDNFRINKLIQEKQRKMAELEKCMGSTKGLKIAGISTLGLTAVGVVGNVAEAKKINEYDDKIESTEKSIEKTQKQIDETRADLAKQKAEAEEKKRQEELKKNCLQSRGEWEDDGYCECGTRNYNSTTGKCDDVAVTTVKLVDGTTVTGVLDPTTGRLTDANGNLIDTAGGTVIGTTTVVAGTGGTSAGGTDAGNATGDGTDILGTATEDKKEYDKQCNVECNDDYKNKYIACTKGSQVNLYRCKDNKWKKIDSLDDCNPYTAPSGKTMVEKTWNKGMNIYIFGTSVSSITGSNPKAWLVTSPCDGCKKGENWNDNSKKCEVKTQETLMSLVNKRSNSAIQYWAGKGTECYSDNKVVSSVFAASGKDCSLLSNNGWLVKYNTGDTLKGTARCWEGSGNYDYCECKVTSYSNHNFSKAKESLSDSYWVGHKDLCEKGCAASCAITIISNKEQATKIINAAGTED